MILALWLAMQVAAGPPASLTVRVGERATTVPVERSARGPVVSAELLASALQGDVRARSPLEFTVTLAGVTMQVAAGAPFVRVADQAITLPAEPSVRDRKLFLPYAIVSDVLPAWAARVSYDPRRRELRFDRPTAESAGPRPPVAGAPADAAPVRKGPASTPRASPQRKRVVVVDAGHGGPDNGMRGPIRGGARIAEKHITLDVARALRKVLVERGVDVVMTRTTDTLIALSDRGRIANERRGDVFISVHVNAANPRWKQPGAARGVETYFLSEAKTEDERRVEQMENEVVKYEIANEVPRDDPLSFIVHDMVQNEHLRESSELAATVQRSLARIHPGPDRGVKQAGFRVLVTAFMPAILVEIGFGTNATEARYLSDSRHQREIAVAIADATLEYLAAYERRAGAAAR